jgi:hypothetical protein
MALDAEVEFMRARVYGYAGVTSPHQAGPREPPASFDSHRAEPRVPPLLFKTGRSRMGFRARRHPCRAGRPAVTIYV